MGLLSGTTMRLVNRLAVLTLAAIPTLAYAEAPATAPATEPVAKAVPLPPAGQPQPKVAPTQPAYKNAAVTQHELTVNGKTIKYEATAADAEMKDDAGKTRGTIFFIYYRRTDLPEAKNRPITYVFNGGPGAASVWLHLGTAGPKRVDLPADGIPTGPPYRLVDNDTTWLDWTDLVFIDPVGTGFSRPATPEEGRTFYGVRQDVQWIAEFIRLHLTRAERWDSPKFLAGESYGTTRAAYLSQYLHDDAAIDLNGVILISSVLQFSTLGGGGANDLPYALFLPTYTELAWYHKKLPADLQADQEKARKESEKFAFETYLPAMARGMTLPKEQRDKLVKELARLTGLSEDVIKKNDLRVGPSRFEKALLADEGKVIGRYDGRMAGYAMDEASDRPAHDPSFDPYLGLYAATFNSYVRKDLNYKSDLAYEVLSDRVRPWDFGSGGQGSLDVAENLRQAMIELPSLRVFIAAGRYDLATPFFAADFTAAGLNLPDPLRKNVVQEYYPGGHMLYHVKAGREKLSADLQKFEKDSVPTN